MKRQYQRYNKETLSQVVSESTSFTEVCRKLAKKPVGGTITNLKLMCKRLEIDCSHMTGQAHMRGKKSVNRKTADEFLILGKPTDHRITASRLRKHLFNEGIKHECNVCGIKEWNDRPLVLEVDHIDECYWNNQKHNLQFLCPNCHSQKTNKAGVA